jgi:hypothetical protein
MAAPTIPTTTRTTKLSHRTSEARAREVVKDRGVQEPVTGSDIMMVRRKLGDPVDRDNSRSRVPHPMTARRRRCPQCPVLLAVDQELSERPRSWVPQNSPIRSARSKSGSIKTWSSSARGAVPSASRASVTVARPDRGARTGAYCLTASDVLRSVRVGEDAVSASTAEGRGRALCRPTPSGSSPRTPIGPGPVGRHGRRSRAA